jgi:nucleotide-binding universal stress UspA family protein
VADWQRSKTVVVGVDTTPGGFEAVAWAAHEARLRGQPLRIVHACTTHDPSRLDQAYGMLDDAVRRARDIDSRLDIRTDLEADDPVPLLEREARTASVLVLGPPGRGGVARQIVDSVGHPTSGPVAPLVVVPEATRGIAARAPVAVLVETSADGTLVAAAAMSAAARSDRRLRAIRVPPPGEDFAESVATLDQLVARACGAYPHVDVETEVQLGRPMNVLADVSSEAALVVVSRLAFGTVSRSVRSVRRSLLGWARCPVMVLPVRLPHGTADPRSERTAV